METINTILKNEQTEFKYDKIYSIEDYLLTESKSFEKNEFRNGEVIQLPGAKPAHNLIAGNIITQLNIALEKAEQEYFVLTSDTKIHIPRFNYFVYPDAVVVYEQIELYKDNSTVITNPLLIV